MVVSLSQRFTLTLDEVKEYLDVDETFHRDDDLIQEMIGAVIGQADHYLNRDWGEEEDGVPPFVSLACKKAIHDWYYEKGGTVKQERRANITVTHGMPDEVAWSFRRMLWPKRKLPGA